MNKTGKPQLQAWPWPLWKRDPGHRAMRMRHEWGHLQSCPLKLWGPRTGNQITSSSLVWWGWEDRGDEGSSKGREFLPLWARVQHKKRRGHLPVSYKSHMWVSVEEQLPHQPPVQPWVQPPRDNHHFLWVYSVNTCLLSIDYRPDNISAHINK